jgi:hypothetical protein
MNLSSDTINQQQQLNNKLKALFELTIVLYLISFSIGYAIRLTADEELQ